MLTSTHGVMCSQGDGVWLPRTQFQGAAWVTSLHKELFAEYSGWSAAFLEVAATAGAAKGFTEVIGFFHWNANNTGVQLLQRSRSAAAEQVAGCLCGYVLQHLVCMRSCGTRSSTAWAQSAGYSAMCLCVRPKPHAER